MALRSTRTRGATAVAGLLGASLALAACGGSSDNGGTTSAGGGASSGSDCSAYSSYGDLKGKTITVYASIVSPEQESQIASYKPFEQCTGAKVKYEGSKEFEAQLPVRVEGGNAPDVAFIPQPGLLQTMVKTGKVIEASTEASANVDKYFGKDWRGYGTVDGKLYGTPLGANVKSFVWYSPKAFADGGYQIPQTWDELMALTDKIAKDHPDAKPWCAGIASDAATGWPATDWLEDLMLRTAGPDVYDQWVAHKIPFNDPQVAAALAKVGAILKNPKYVNGGIGDVSSIATTSFNDAGLTILDGTCYMHRQASFYAANWPKKTKVGPDGDVFAFYLPTVDPAKGKPVEGGGEFVATFRKAPEVQAFQAFTASPEWANSKAKSTPGGGWVSANKGLDVANLSSPIDQLAAKTLQDPKAIFRFDGSDVMPGAVGAGSFWKGMTDWITGKSDADTLNYIEKSWPKS